jgi:hypothetical protein
MTSPPYIQIDTLNGDEERTEYVTESNLGPQVGLVLQGARFCPP